MKIRKVVKYGTVIGGVVGAKIVVDAYKKKLKKEEKLSRRFKAHYQLAHQWLLNKQKHCKSVGEYLDEKGINSIAIYGMGTLGELVYEDLGDCKSKVVCFVDKNADEEFQKGDKPVMNIVGLKKRKGVDLILVTPFYDYEDIRYELRKQGIHTDLISLEKIINDLSVQ